MNRQPSTLIATPSPSNYDECLITQCLKKLCGPKAKTETNTLFAVYNQIADIRKELEAVNKTGIPELSFSYLEAMEQTIPGAEFNYVVVYKKNRPVLFVYFQLFPLTSHNFNLEKNKGFAKRIVRLFLDLKKVSVLISGNALRNDTPCCCFDENSVSQEQATELVVAVAEKVAASKCVAGLVLKDISVEPGKKEWLADLGFNTPWEDQEMVLDINANWETLTGYTNALSRKYKTRARKILDAGRFLTIKNLGEDELTTHNKDIMRLFRNVADSQSFTLTQPGEEHFRALKKIYRADFEVTGIFLNEKLVAFYSAFITREAYELYYAGFDYDANNEYQLYFNLLFSGLERAIFLKKDKLKLGRTSFDAKASMGAIPASLNYYFKPGFIPGMVATWFSSYFSSMEDTRWKQRTPLK